MNKKSKFLIVLIIINFIISISVGLFQNKVYAYATNQTVNTDIASIDENKYPGIKSMIQELQKDHPNWNFKLVYTGLNWDDVIKAESKHGRNTIQANRSNYNGEWICKTCQSTGTTYNGWVCVSDSAIKYMMDPRNSLYYADIFQFMELSYDSEMKYDIETIKAILKDTFLDDGNLDSYAKSMITSGEKYKVNPYYIAVKAIQEQGTKGGSTFKMKDENGDEGYTIDEEKKVIKVVPNTNAKQIKEYLGNTYKIYNKNKQEIVDSDLVGTGYEVEDKYTIVVLGDLNCDGQVKATDYMKLKNYLTKVSSLDEYQKIAADVNFDNSIKATDYMKIKNYILKVSNISFMVYYNIFNINATETKDKNGNVIATIKQNALLWAKDKGWTTIEKCIEGGAQFLGENYISKGQDTMYFEKYNVVNPTLYVHQYAQDVMYAQNQGTELRKILDSIKATDYSYTFVIPLYENMPKTKCVRPSTN